MTGSRQERSALDERRASQVAGLLGLVFALMAALSWSGVAPARAAVLTGVFTGDHLVDF
ncbi:hypothetical protein [Austwickia chelonae]|uniref:hypothetical protein n=1 Tax=Austwickia chelonae TaxID=100225 RepID=UPI0013C2AB8D|nr:hypothetical protein [Austwickia chelonae]